LVQFWGLIELFQARLLDLAYLLADEPQALHVTTYLHECIGRDQLALGRACSSRRSGAFLSFGVKLRMPIRARVP
jgi:hypothetical protein